MPHALHTHECKYIRGQQFKSSTIRQFNIITSPTSIWQLFDCDQKWHLPYTCPNKVEIECRYFSSSSGFQVYIHGMPVRDAHRNTCSRKWIILFITEKSHSCKHCSVAICYLRS